MKVSKSFDIAELVHPEYIKEYGEEKMIRVLKMYAPLMLEGLEHLKEFIGGYSIIINDYKWNGNFINSGLRHPLFPLANSAPLSAHYFMQATDCKFKSRDCVELQNAILQNQRSHPCIVRMENALVTKNWLHIQFGYRKLDQTIKVFNP